MIKLLRSRRDLLKSLAAAAVPMAISNTALYAQTILSGRSRPKWVLPAVDQPELDRIIFASAIAGADVSVHVLRPPGYKETSCQRYPVLYWLHGTGSAETSVGPLAMRFAKAMQSGELPPSFIVFPNGLEISLWCDSADGTMPVESVFIRETISLIDTRFRTLATRNSRIIEGFSMGGFGAGHLGFRYPALFGAVSMLGAGPLQTSLSPELGPAVNAKARKRLLKTVFADSQALFLRENPITLATSKADVLRDGSLIRVVIGSDDMTLPANRDFSAALDKLKIPHSFTVVERVGHNALPLINLTGFAFHRDFLANS